MKCISGSSNQQLAQKIAAQFGAELLSVSLDNFKNGEKRVWVQEQIHGQNITIIQSFSDPVDEHIMEFLLLSDALERLGARHINAIIPWMGYSLQDKVFRKGEPIAAKVVANLVSNAYVKRAFLLDLHNTSTPGFFSIPTTHLSALDIFVEYAQDTFDQDNTIVASPDFGGLKRARVFADHLKTHLVNIDKKRDLTSGEVEAVTITGGDVTGKDVLLFDDCIVSGSTVIETAKLLKEQGADSVHFFATHGLFAGDSLEKLSESTVDTVITTNSIAHTQLPDKIVSLDVSQLFANELKKWDS